MSCADWDSGSSPAPAAALPPIEDDAEELPPAPLESPEGLTPAQEQLPAEDALETVLSVWLRPAAVLSGQVQFPLDSEMLGELSLDEVPVLGLTLTLLSVVDCANAEPNAPITTAAVRLTARCLTLMCSFSICRWGETTLSHASAVPPTAVLSLSVESAP